VRWGGREANLAKVAGPKLITPNNEDPLFTKRNLPSLLSFRMGCMYTVERCLSALFKELPPHFGLNELF
jgi:hypothetical protein